MSKEIRKRILIGGALWNDWILTMVGIIRILQPLVFKHLDKDKFDEKTVELLMDNAESLRTINDNTTKQEPEAAVTQEPEEKEVTVKL